MNAVPESIPGATFPSPTEEVKGTHVLFPHYQACGGSLTHASLPGLFSSVSISLSISYLALVNSLLSHSPVALSQFSSSNTCKAFFLKILSCLGLLNRSFSPVSHTHFFSVE